MENLQRDSYHWLLPPMSTVDTGESGHRIRLLVALDDRTSLLAILLVATAVAAGTLWILSQTIDLYFPADAGEYVADARALLGGGVREIRHAPLFPLLVALFLGSLGPISSTQLSMAIAPTLFHRLERPWTSGFHVFLRRCHSLVRHRCWVLSQSARDSRECFSRHSPGLGRSLLGNAR